MIDKQLIFEELSISNEVNDKTNEIKELILNELDKVEINNYNMFQIPTKFIEIELKQPIFDICNKIHVLVYYFKDKTEYINNYNRLDIGGEFSITETCLKLKIVAIDNVINNKMLISMLKHELHHIFQENLIHDNGHLSDLYQKALYVITNYLKFPIFINRLAKIIYFLDKKEIDANMQSYYQELKREQGNTERNNILRQYEIVTSDFEQFKELCLDEEYRKEVLETFGVDSRKLRKYIENMISYFNTTKSKVLTKYTKECALNEAFKNDFNRFIL